MPWDEKAFSWTTCLLSFPFGLLLHSLDYALRIPRSGWQQESVVPIFESHVGLSCFLKWASDTKLAVLRRMWVISVGLSEL